MQLYVFHKNIEYTT